MQLPEDQILTDIELVQIAGDRRLKKRFALELIVTYRIVERGLAKTGNGKTINVSSSGVAFVTNDHLNVGDAIQLAISWPVLLNHKCALKLIIDGIVVRSGAGFAAVAGTRYEFRTQPHLGKPDSEHS